MWMDIWFDDVPSELATFETGLRTVRHWSVICCWSNVSLYVHITNSFCEIYIYMYLSILYNINIYIMMEGV